MDKTLHHNKICASKARAVADFYHWDKKGQRDLPNLHLSEKRNLTGS